MDKKEILSQNLKICMSKLDMSTRDLSILLGCNVKTVNSWLNSNYYPNLKTLIKICSVFHISLEELTNPISLSKSTDDALISEMCEILKDLKLENYIYVKAPLYNFVKVTKEMKGNITDAKIK